MNRRGFFGLLAGAAVAPLIPLPELEVVTRKIFLPPAGGWVARGGNTLLTVDMIARESLRILRVQGAFIVDIQREYDPRFAEGNRTATINITRPERYGLRAGDLITIEGVHA